MSLREEQCDKVCRILDDVLANRPTERDSLIVAVRKAFDAMQTARPEPQTARVFQEIIVEYPSISTYPEYEGKPYFSVKYTENGQGFIGYGTYKPEVLSEYLIKYFMPFARPEIMRCRDCKHFEYDHVETVNGIPLIVAHEICMRWSDGVKTSENGYCFLAERREAADGNHN